jgi:hypothetical protein
MKRGCSARRVLNWFFSAQSPDVILVLHHMFRVNRMARRSVANISPRARNGRSPCSGKRSARLKMKSSMRNRWSGWRNQKSPRRQAKFGRSGLHAVSTPSPAILRTPRAVALGCPWLPKPLRRHLGGLGEQALGVPMVPVFSLGSDVQGEPSPLGTVPPPQKASPVWHRFPHGCLAA